MKRPIKFLLITCFTALLAVLLVAGAVAAGCGSQSEASEPVEVHTPFGLYAPGTLDEVPPSNAQAMMESLGVSSLAAYQDYHLGLIRDLGVTWVRVDFLWDGWNFQEPVDYLNKLNASGVEVVGCARPLNSFVSQDLTQFQAALGRLVRRYPFVKVWQIGNEPNISWDNPGDYPRFFLAGQQAVRSACSDCRIALAGVAAAYPSRQEAFDEYDRIVTAILQGNSSQTPAFDIFDMHYYHYAGEDGTMEQALADYQDLLKRDGMEGAEIWVTETATHTGTPVVPTDAPTQTEEQQAAELVRRFVTMLGDHVTRVSWARIYENYGYAAAPGNYYDHCGLIYNGLGAEQEEEIAPGTKKMSYYAYHTTVAELQRADQEQKLGPGSFEFSFDADDNRNPVFVLWDEGGGAGIPPQLSGRIKVTDLTGSEQEMDAGELVLSATPVFVEQA